jgi:hypothetical protein
VKNKSHLSIKHMVCARCIEAVTQIAQKIGLKPTSIVLGEISFSSPLDSQQMHAFREELEARGFTINETENERLMNKVETRAKRVIPQVVECQRGFPSDLNFGHT